nr:unnamed protein product [Spirometra erinaceieuropaei]
MTEPSTTKEVDDLYLQMSPWGDFFVWTSRHVQWLRRRHRIFGRLLSQTGIRSSSSVTSAKTTLAAIPSVRLPLCLSLEETSLILYQRIAKGLDIVRPLTDLQPPLVSDLVLYDEALATHFEEMTEVYKAQKRQRMLSYYGEMLAGQRKRRTRRSGQHPSNTEPVDKEETQNDTQVDEFGVRISKKRLKKLLRRRKRRRTQLEDHSIDYMDDESSESAFDSPEQQDEEEAVKGENSLLGTRQPTLDELITDSYASGSQSSIEQLHAYVPIHRPRPTPREWRRHGEHQQVDVPEHLHAEGLPAIVRWLIALSSKARTGAACSSDSAAPEVDEEKVILKCRVFADLWSRGFCVTGSAMKMGGDFLLYPGDPLFYHASHIVCVATATSQLKLAQLSTSLRIANSVRKVLLLATSPLEAEEQPIMYTSLYWTGSNSHINPIL